MELTETARVRLRIDGQEAVSELTKLEEKYKDLVEQQGAFAKRSKEWNELQKEIKELGTTIDIVRERTDVAGMTFSELNRYQKDLVKSMKDMKQGSDDYVAASDRLKEVNTRIDSIRTDMRATNTETVAQKGTWDNLKTWIVGAFAVEAIIEFGKRVLAAGVAVFELTGKFEKYETVLKNTLGGQDEAIAAMDMIKKIAAETPVSVDEMTDSFIKMVNRGLTPSKTEIKNLADLAASQGKSFDQLTEAVLDAMMGEGERMKEFGIKMKKNGDDISLNFKGQTVSVKNNEKAIYDAIVAMGAYNGVAGTTSEMSKTLEGRVSNLGDAWDFIQLNIGQRLKPVFVAILELFAKGVDWLGQLIDASGPVGDGFMVIWDALKLVFDIGKNLFLALIPDGIEKTVTLKNVMNVLGIALNAVGNIIKIVFSTVQLLIDGFVVLGNAGSVAVNILKGDFAGAAKSAADLRGSWDTLKDNASKNFGSIANSFKSVWTTTKDATQEATKEVDMYANVKKKTNTELTEDEEKEIEKRKKADLKATEERKQANEKAINDIAILRGKATGDELQQATAKYNAEKDRIDKLKIDEKIKADYLTALEEKYKSDVDAIRDKMLNNRRVRASDEVNLIDRTVQKEREAAETIEKMQEHLHNRVLGWHEEKEKANKRRLEQQYTDELNNFSAIGALMQGDLTGFGQAMGKKLDSVTQFKLGAATQYFQFYQIATGYINDVVGKFAEAATTMINISQMKLTAELNNIEKRKLEENKGIRDIIKDQDEQLSKLNLRIAELELERFNTTDKRRQDEITAELAKLEKEKQGIVLNREVTVQKLDMVNTAYDQKVAQQKLDAWNKQKQLEIKMAMINATQAYVKALSSGFPPFNYATAALVLKAAKEQVELIKSESPPDFGFAPTTNVDYTTVTPVDKSKTPKNDSPSFGNGTFQAMRDDTYFENAGVLGGLRHGTPEGGNWVINPRTGKLLAKVEAGEFLGVFSRDMTARHGGLLRKLANSSIARNGKPVYAEDGYFGQLDGGSVDVTQASALAVEAGTDLNTIAVNTGETTAAVVVGNGIMREMVGHLANIAASSERVANKEFSVSINQIIEKADIKADIDRRSSFG